MEVTITLTEVKEPIQKWVGEGLLKVVVVNPTVRNIVQQKVMIKATTKELFGSTVKVKITHY